MAKFNVGDRVYFSCTAGSGEGVIESKHDIGYFVKSDGVRNYGRSDGLYWASKGNIELVEAAKQPKFKAGDRVRGKATGFEYVLRERHPHMDDFGHGVAWYVGDPGTDSWVGEKQVKLVGAAKQTKFNVGDRVKILAEKTPYSLAGGKDTRGTVEGDAQEAGHRGDYVVQLDGRLERGHGVIGFKESELEPLGPELNVGDHAIITEWTRQLHGFNFGDVVEIVETDVSPGHSVAVKHTDGFIHGFTEFEYLKPVEQPTKKYVKMLTSDDCDGYDFGDILEVTEDGEFFIDNDGDERPLWVHDHEEVTPGQAKSDEITREDVIDFLRTKDADELLDIIEEARD